MSTETSLSKFTAKQKVAFGVGGVNLVASLITLYLWLSSADPTWSGYFGAATVVLLFTLATTGVCCYIFGVYTPPELPEIAPTKEIVFPNPIRRKISESLPPLPEVTKEPPQITTAAFVGPAGIAVPEGYELVRLEPNLVELSKEAVVAFEGDNGMIVQGSRLGCPSLTAICLPYHNSARLRPKRNIRAAQSVAAKMSFHFFGDQQAFNVHRCVWLNEEQIAVGFEKDAKRRLVLAIIDESQIFTLEREFSGAFPHGFTTRKDLGSSSLIKVAIQLSEDTHEVTSRSFIIEVHRDDGVRIEVTEANLWKYNRVGDLLRHGYEKGIHLPMTFNENAEKKAKYLSIMTDWEDGAAAFIARHFTKAQSESFLACSPSFEEGFNQKEKFLFNFALPGSPPPEPSLPFWTPYDSLKSRTRFLENLQGTIKLSF